MRTAFRSSSIFGSLSCTAYKYNSFRTAGSFLVLQLVRFPLSLTESADYLSKHKKFVGLYVILHNGRRDFVLPFFPFIKCEATRRRPLQEKLLVLTREKSEVIEEAKSWKAEASASKAEATARLKEARQQRLAGVYVYGY